MGKLATYDYSDYQEQAPLSEDGMARLARLATELLRAEAAVEKAEEELKASKERLRNIAEGQLPALMEQFKMEEFSTQDGLQIKIREIIRGSIPKPNEAKAFAWLEDIGEGRVIKRQFTIDFGKEEDKWAAKFQRDLARRKKPLNVKRKMAVAAPTLQSLVRQRLEEGKPVDFDVLGVYRQRIANVKMKTK